MAGLSKLLSAVPKPTTKSVVAVATLTAGVLFYVNRRVVDAR